jgi:hypothetical protein
MNFIEKVKGMLLDPTGTYQNLKDEDMGAALRYFVIWLLIFSALAAVIFAVVGTAVLSMIPQTAELGMLNSFIGAGGGIVIAGAMFIAILIFGVIGVFIGAAIIHLGVLLVGGNNGYGQTVKSLIYGGTPSYLFGWIPFIGIIGSIWSLILIIFGVKELQEVSTGKAVIAVLIPVVIIAAIAGIAMIGAILSGLSGLPPTVPAP